MPFPPEMIVPWVRHETIDRQCLICGLKNIPGPAVHADNMVYEKQGRYCVDVPERFNICGQVTA